MTFQAPKSEFPKGNITLVFTDIESSSENWERYGHAFGPVLARHNAILREAAAKWQGYEVKTEGDSFFIAFGSASNAISFAVEVQSAIREFPWPSVHPQVNTLRVRIGMHTGEALIVSESERAVDYFGSSVNRAARICSCAQGGQILLSQATYATCYKDPKADISYLDLGEFELRGVGQERLYQVCHSRIEREFQDLKASKAVHNNLPTQLTKFLGREQEIAWAVEAISKDRLVTLAGPGGIGKTRLSLAVAERVISLFPGGVYFVELAAVSNHTDVISAIADTLNIQEISSRSVLETLEDYLKSKSVLLVLDNFEHVLPAAEHIGHLLIKCPDLKVLVTSRTVLNIHGEYQYAIPPLSLPRLEDLTSQQSVEKSAALGLFVESARRVKPEFRYGTREIILMAKICERLEGLPLAIELAASKAKVLTLEAILSRLDKRFDLLTGGPKTAPDRHKTLRAAIDSSFELLETQEKNLLMILSVFVGGFSLDMAEEICRADPEMTLGVVDGITSLCDKSLVRPLHGLGLDGRFTILETIRQYCIEKAVNDLKYKDFEARHALVYGSYVRELSKHSLSGKQMEIFESFETDLGNIRAAMDWGIRVRDISLCASFLEDLWPFWVIRGKLEEAWKYFQSFQTLSSLEVLSRDFPKAVIGGAVVAYFRADGECTVNLAVNALPFCIAKNERRHQAIALLLIGCVELFLGKYDDAVERWNTSVQICEELNELWVQSICKSMLGFVSLLQNDLAKARKFGAEGFAKARATNELWVINHSLYKVAVVAEAEGDIERARSLLRESLFICRQLQYMHGLSLSFVGLARVAFRRGDCRRAIILIAANDWMKDEYRIQMPPAYLIFYKIFRDETFEVVSKQMGQSTIDKWSEMVSEMDLEELIEFALNDENHNEAEAVNT